jgi:cytochrome c biogenesis protein CcmG/thiol:disulfide interchange protein DsbE
MKRPILLWAPLGLFIMLAAFMIWGLSKPNDQTIPSKLVGTAVPEFVLPAAAEGLPGLSSQALAGQGPHLVNIFASWCVPCAAEAPQLKAIADAGVPIVGIAIRDRRPDLADFLGRYGNPFRAIGADDQSRVQLALGSSGVPESFVIDSKGVIRLQKIGPINPEDVASIIATVQAAQ